MRSRSLRSETVCGVVAVVVGVVLLSVCAVQGGAEPPKAGAAQLLTRGPASGAPVQVSPQCGAVLHDPHRVITFVWNPAPPSNGYQVEVDCFECLQVGHWNSEVGPPQFVSTSGATTATFTFTGDNKGRWRVRGTQTASAPGISAIQAGPWSPWCKFRFETGGTLGEPPQARPDITAGIVDPSTETQRGVVFGGGVGGSGGKFVAWGSAVNLAEADSFQQSGGKCAFNVTYAMSNLGPVATAPAFVNRLRSDGNVVAVNSALSLGAGEKNHKITTQPYLDPGPHTLQLSLDDAPGVVAESDEANNMFSVRYVLSGKCAGPQPGQPCGMALVFTLSTNSGHPGDTFEMTGTWGATQGTKVPRINMGGSHDLQVLSWTDTVLKVRIPVPLDPGVHKVGVYCTPPEMGTTQSTEFLPFTVLGP